MRENPARLGDLGKESEGSVSSDDSFAPAHPLRGGRAPRRENIDHFLVDNFIFGGINRMCSISEDGGGPSFSVFRTSTVLHKLSFVALGVWCPDSMSIREVLAFEGS